MKKLVIMAAAAFFIACGGGSKSGTQLADEVCECYKKANGLPASDPASAKEQDNCLKLQGTNWRKIQTDKVKSDEFNKKLGECTADLLKQSMGQ